MNKVLRTSGMSRISEKTWDKAEEIAFELSSAIVRRMWQSVSYTEGVLLTDIEAILGDDIRSIAFKNVVKRELRRMGSYIQDSIYNEYKVQEHTANHISEPVEIAEDSEGALKIN
jgi:hypothetical protein